MKCRNCSLVKDEFDKRMNCYYQGLYSKWYDGYSEEEITDDLEQCCWCEKTGGKLCWTGKCEDVYETSLINIKKCSKQRKRNKRERDLKYKQHLKFLAENIQYYPSPVVYIDELWIKGYGYIENSKPYYKRIYRSNARGASSQHKKNSNRKVRRYKGEISNRSQYKKIYDYWYEMY